MRLYFCGLSLLLLVSASSASAQNYIIGGQEVDVLDPIQAATVGIFEPSPDGHSGSLCSGTLVRKNMVLTAAHCIHSRGPKPTVIFGPELHSPTVIQRPAEAVAVNPKWSTHAGVGMDQGDIALVKFSGGTPRGYSKVSTARSDADIPTGSQVTLAGYGISDAHAKTGAGRLRKADVQILHNRPGKSEMILDQSHGRGACHGDSGGPAFISKRGKIILAGVTNRGYPGRSPDDCGHQVVYTKVPAYRSWIQKSEKQLDSAPAPPILLTKNANMRKRVALLSHKANLRSHMHKRKHRKRSVRAAVKRRKS